ncbi:hypothetical protein EC968_007410 [Mortierella alpina]|nr:hypothetical protein EC968_007410 [Mortierella alpina]
MLHSNSSLYHEQQYRHQREYSEQQSPPLSSSPSSSHHHSHRQSMNQYPSQSVAPGSAQYRDHQSYEYPQQARSQPHHSQHQQHPAQYPQHDRDNEPHHHHRQQGHQGQHQQHQHHQQQHQQSYGAQNHYHSSQIQLPHHQHPVPPLKHEDHSGSHSDNHAIPVIQSSDPSFSQRPHARSFSNSHPHPHPSQQPSHATIPQQHQHEQQHLPRLHHSVSAGHLSVAGHRPFSAGGSASSSAFLGTKKGTAPGAPAPVKKKDPYATAWRTYSKIAEELNLLNPDGSLYPISKEAILKYLRHQSKRIKSSNLHWYVNGLKKHQENLGFSWDEVRYDDQVLALLKELTLHPVPIESNLTSGSNNSTSHSNGGLDQTARQRHVGGMAASYPQTNNAPQRSISGSIDTSRIATLSISDPQHSKHNPQQSQQLPHQIASTGKSKRQPSQSGQYEEAPFQAHIRQQSHSYSQRSQPYHSSSVKATSYHSAPVQLPSQHSQDEDMSQEGSLQRSKTHSYSSAQAPDETSTSAGSSPMSSSELHIPQLSHVSISNGSNVKRKRHEFVSERLARLASPLSPEDELYDEDDSKPRNIDREDRAEDPEDDLSDRVALKRHASTGTLRSHVRISNMSAISSEPHHYQRQGEFSHRDYPISTPSPAARENELNGGSHFRWESRLSPPGSVSSVDSASPGNRGTLGGGVSILSTQRHRRANGVVSSPITVMGSTAAHTSAASSEALAAMDSTPTVPNSKTTIQFSEVVEYAQQLQSKYGNQCRDHPWGCVELSEHHHLELTIKMYMDWAGLVASGRLTMDEIPDLPEFRKDDLTLQDASSLSPSPSPAPSNSSGGTLKRMTSTPLTTTFGSFSISMQPRQRQASSSPHTAQGRPRSPSSSPVFGGQTISDSLMSRIGSQPPQRAAPALPAGALSPDSSVHGYNPSVRARKMASSPSLGRQFTFQPRSRLHTTHGGMRGSPSPPPVPPIPSGISQDDYRSGLKESLPIRSTAPPSAASPPASEVMDLSGDEGEEAEDYTGRRHFSESPNSVGSRDQESQQGPVREPLHGSDLDHNSNDEVEMEDAGLEHHAYEVEHRSQTPSVKQESLSSGVWNGVQDGAKLRVGTKGLRPSSSSLSPSVVFQESKGQMNSDPISIPVMSMMPNLQPRSPSQQQEPLSRDEPSAIYHEDSAMET